MRIVRPMKLVARLALAIAVLLGALAVGIAALTIWSRASAPAPSPRTAAERRVLNLRVFDRVWSTVETRYYDRRFHGVDWQNARKVWRRRAEQMPNTSSLYMVVLANMLNELNDSHTSATPPDEPLTRPAAASATAAPEADCPGLDLLLGAVTRNGWGGPVIDVRRGTPAERAGIEPGWRIVRAYFSQSASACRWTSRLQLEDDDGRTRVLRDDAPPSGPSLARHASQNLADGARVVSFTGFDGAQTRWLLGELARAPRQGVVLDLRRNGGGDEFALKVIAGVLLGPGAPLAAVLTHGRTETFRSAPLSWWRRQLIDDHVLADRRPYTGPLVVLIGPGTSSAAELLADALQHEHRALLVGDRSAGSVLMAKHFALPDGGTLSVSVADALGASGRRLEGAGVAPDVHVRQTIAALRAGRDRPLEAADAVLQTARR